MQIHKNFKTINYHEEYNKKIRFRIDIGMIGIVSIILFISTMLDLLFYSRYYIVIFWPFLISMIVLFVPILFVSISQKLDSIIISTGTIIIGRRTLLDLLLFRPTALLFSEINVVVIARYNDDKYRRYLFVTNNNELFEIHEKEYPNLLFSPKRFISYLSEHIKIINYIDNSASNLMLNSFDNFLKSLPINKRLYRLRIKLMKDE